MEQNIKSITSEFLHMENKLNLFEVSINGIFVWKLIRFPLYMNILQIHGLYEAPHPNQKRSFFKKISSTLRNSISRGYRTSAENLIIGSEKVVAEGSILKDKYLFDVVDNCRDAELISQSGLLGSKYNYSSIYKLIQFRKRLCKEGKKISEEITDYIKSVFGLTINVENLLRKRIAMFKTQKQFFSKNTGDCVKQAYLVCSYGKEGIISALHEKGVKVIELQHGVFTEFHLGYHFPGDKTIPYFPNSLLLFGKNWKGMAKLPKKCELKVVGFPYLEHERKKYDVFDKYESTQTVVIISQGNFISELIKLANKIALNSDIFLTFRPHPSENVSEIKVLLNDKIKIVDPKHEGLYETIVKNKYVIGVSSTALFEALAFNKTVIVYKIPGYEYMNGLIEKNQVVAFKEPEKIAEYIGNNNEVTNLDKISNLFFAKRSK